MWERHVRHGLWAGLVAAGASAGALTAFAVRQGDALRPARAIGASLFTGVLPPALHPLLGLLLHVAASLVWGGLLGIVAARLRGPALLVAAAAVTLLAALVHARFLPMLRLGYGLSSFPPHGAPLVFLYTLYAAALALGMTLARRAS